MNKSSIERFLIIIPNPLFHLTHRPHPFVGALLGQLLGDARDVLGGVGDGLGAGDELPLARLGVPVDQLGEPGHEVGHPLGRRDDVVVLGGPLLHLLVEVVGGHLGKGEKERNR